MASSVGSEATTIGDNVGLVAAMIAVVVAQVLKPFSDWTVTWRLKAGLMVGSGGFPSSHSSLVTALATGAAYQSGLGDPAFATALVLALVVRAAPPPGRVPPRDERQHPSENQNPRSSRPLLRERRDGCDSGISLATKKGTFFFRSFRAPRRVRETQLTRQYASSSKRSHTSQVMYDAMGVRRQAGYHATAINNLVTAFPSEAAFGRHAHSETDSLEAGLVAGGYHSGGGGDANDASNVRDERRNGGGERDENASESRNRDSDALLGGMDEVAETFQQGFQDFLTALQERPLREHIGHTPVQVLAGGVLGVVVGTAYALALHGEAGAR